MTTSKNTRIDSSSSHLSSEELLNYFRHLLPDEEKKRVENHLNSCELCSDALKGLAELPDALRLYQITHELKKRINKRVTTRKKIFSRIDIITLFTLLFIIGIIILITYYILIFRKA